MKRVNPMKKINRLITGTMALAMLTTLVAVQATPVSAATAIKVTVNQNAVSFPDTKPYLDNNRVLIPARFVSVALGGKVDYKNKVVTIKQDGKTIKMKINSSKVTVDNKTVTLDVPAKVVKGRMVVPLRFVSEALGASVDWNQNKSLVAITTGTATSPTPTTPTTPTAGNFKFDPNFTTLAKQLFVNNMKEENGVVSFTVPMGSTATFNTNKGKMSKLVPGQSYSYNVGKDAGYVIFKYVDPSKVVPGAQKQAEFYTLTLDPSLLGKPNSVKAIVLVEDSKLKETSGTIDEIILLAKNL